jgi:tetratricopeptide (TPR) repeat protein
MDVRKFALIAGIAGSCAGCVSETKTVHVTPETAAKIKNIKEVKEVETTAHEAKPQTWISVGEVYETKANDPHAQPVQQSTMRDEARKAYQKAIDLDRKCAAAYVHLANLYMQQNDLERASVVYQQALQQDPKTAALWHEAGMVHCRRQDLNTAVACLGQAHQLEPDNRNYATQFGFCLAWAGRPGEAAQVLCRAMNKADAHYNVARMMARMNQPEVSRQYLQVALAERPTHQGALTLLAQLDGPRTGPASNIGGGMGNTGVHPAAYGAPR